MYVCMYIYIAILSHTSITLIIVNDLRIIDSRQPTICDFTIDIIVVSLGVAIAKWVIHRDWKAVENFQAVMLQKMIYRCL